MLKRSVHVVLAAFTGIALVTGCSDDDSPTDPGGGTTPASVAGTWNWEVSNITSSCGNEPGWSAVVVITQSGTAVQAESDWRSDPGTGPHVGAGSVNGREVSINVNYPEAGGNLFAQHTVDLEPDNVTMVGSESWTWFGPDELCDDGTATVTATKQD